MKRQFINIILISIFIIGLCIFLYPPISNFINSVIQSKEIGKYEHLSAELTFNEYEEIFLEAEQYNKNLIGNQLNLNIEKSQKTNYKELLSLDSTGIMGYLNIEKIDVRLPIYHGTDASTLQKGIGHLEGSSLPIETKTQHVILSGHTGLPSSKLLTDLVELEVGDEFRIDVLNKRYKYKVDQILVVEPDDTQHLEIVNDRQYATLITCTPYGVNTHRLLVRGILQNEIRNIDILADATFLNTNKLIPILLILTTVLIIIIFLIRQKFPKTHII